MKQLAIRILYIALGQLVFALGIVLMIKANIGYAPWEVFHVGLAYTTGLSIGLVSIIIGIIIIAIVAAFGEKIGFGTILSMVLCGVFIDLIMLTGFVSTAESFTAGIIMLLIGLLLVAYGSYLYMKTGLGAGPRDNLMVVLNRKTRLPVGVCRSAVEVLVTLAGWLLGGMVGIGTIISAVAVGFFIQLVFALFKFDVAAVRHETLQETAKLLLGNRK